jgi:hypothetical protein
MHPFFLFPFSFFLFPFPSLPSNKIQNHTITTKYA